MWTALKKRKNIHGIEVDKGWEKTSVKGQTRELFQPYAEEWDEESQGVEEEGETG